MNPNTAELIRAYEAKTCAFMSQALGMKVEITDEDREQAREITREILEKQDREPMTDKSI